jgi:hypothetical protein
VQMLPLAATVEGASMMLCIKGMRLRQCHLRKAATL